MADDSVSTESRLWDVANDLRANSKLKASEYATPVLGLIFLRHADFRFQKAHDALKKEIPSDSRLGISKLDFQEKGALYLPKEARYSTLLSLAEGENIGQAINDAMKAIEKDNEDLKGTLPKVYTSIDDDLLIALLKTFSRIDVDDKGDVFGNIYEYFLGKFAMEEGRKGGQFYTPTSLVKLIVNVIEPFHGKILDPACGSGGMFVQSAKFVEEHNKRASSEISIYGQERITETVNLCKMNLAVHGLSGDIKEGNTFYEDVHDSCGRFDFVMANPPFNVHKVDYKKVKGDARWEYGLPSNDNANYLWIQAFWSALNENGRAGFVMANSASDARGNEKEIRKRLVEDNAIDVMISIGPNFFYTVTNPCMLWFLDRGKVNTDRKDKVLFIDARNIYHQIDRAHRDFSSKHLEEITGIVQSFRGENGSKPYEDVKGLCKVATNEEICKQEYSLNPSCYVGIVKTKQHEDFAFKERLEELTEELEELNSNANNLQEKIIENMNEIIM